MSTWKFIILFFILILTPSFARAASLYIDPDTGALGPGDIFESTIRIDNQGECVNAVEANLDFSNENLSLVDFSVGDSVLNLWVKKPQKNDFAGINSTGTFYFAGGVPGGYCGRISGDVDDTNVIAKAYFEVRDAENKSAKISFATDSRALLNDGLGTEARLDLAGASYNIEDMPATRNDLSILSEDTIPPEAFVIELNQIDGVLDNRYFIIFSTVDKQSGMDHYEVMETSPEELRGEKPRRRWLDILFGKESLQSVWVVAEMPYPLTDQSLHSLIRVKAVDKAGNERIVEYSPEKEIATSNTVLYFYLAVILLLVVASLAYLIFTIKKYFKFIIRK